MAEAAGPVLALDLGEARIGVARTDPERTLALPFGTVRVTGGVEDLKAVATLVRESGVAEIVVGHPVGLSGERGPAARRAEAFADGLRQAGGRGSRRRARVDATAATVILEAWLARLRPT